MEWIGAIIGFIGGVLFIVAVMMLVDAFNEGR